MTTTLRLDRRHFVIGSVLAGTALLAPTRRRAWATVSSGLVVDTSSGKIRGAAVDGIHAFKGIP